MKLACRKRSVGQKQVNSEQAWIGWVLRLFLVQLLWWLVLYRGTEQKWQGKQINYPLYFLLCKFRSLPISHKKWDSSDRRLYVIWSSCISNQHLKDRNHCNLSSMFPSGCDGGGPVSACSSPAALRGGHRHPPRATWAPHSWVPSSTGKQQTRQHRKNEAGEFIPSCYKERCHKMLRLPSENFRLLALKNCQC